MINGSIFLVISNHHITKFELHLQLEYDLFFCFDFQLEMFVFLIFEFVYFFSSMIVFIFDIFSSLPLKLNEYRIFANNQEGIELEKERRKNVVFEKLFIGSFVLWFIYRVVEVAYV